MEFDQYFLLAAFLLPAGALAAINLLLALGGEAGTLLLPSLRGYPKVELKEAVAPVAKPVRAPSAVAAEGEAGLRRAA